MEDVEKLQYLRHLLQIASADKEIRAAEEAIIERVRKDIGAGKTLLKQAMESQGDVKLSVLARLSDRLRNIEDMLDVALSDGEVAETEKPLIVAAAKQAGLTQELVNAMLSEAKARQKKAGGRCPKCGAENAADAKFCSSCGAAMLETAAAATAKRTDFDIASAGVTVAFAESSSASFPEALTLARAISTFQEALRLNKRWYAVSAPTAELPKLIPIADQISGLRNVECYLDGKQVDIHSVFGFASCASERTKSYRPDGYCFGLDESRFNVWGCKMLRMDWTSWADWFSYGRFINEKTFDFDHAQIAHELTQRLESVRLCPHLRLDFIKAVLSRLPRRVSVSRGGEWDYRRCYNAGPNSIEVTVVSNEAGFSMTEKFDTNGVSPRDATFGVKLLKDAAAQVGLRDLVPQALRQ